jgi:hypothetical protein
MAVELERGLRRQSARLLLSIAASALAVFGVMGACAVGIPYAERRDTGGAPLMRGEGVVEDITLAAIHKQHLDREWLVTLRVDGKRALARVLREFHAGERVEVGYRVRRSGRVYVEEVAPAGERAAGKVARQMATRVQAVMFEGRTFA